MRRDAPPNPAAPGIPWRAGPSYTRAARLAYGGVLAIGSLFALAVIAANARAGALPPVLFGFLFLVVMGVTFRFVFSSRTSIDAGGLRQSWVIRKRADWDEIRYARFTEFPLAHCLVVVKKSGAVSNFYSGTPELDAALRQVAAALPRRD
jgi:hypothetical protein